VAALAAASGGWRSQYVLAAGSYYHYLLYWRRAYRSGGGWLKYGLFGYSIMRRLDSSSSRIWRKISAEYHLWRRRVGVKPVPLRHLSHPHTMAANSAAARSFLLTGKQHALPRAAPLLPAACHPAACSSFCWRSSLPGAWIFARRLALGFLLLFLLQGFLTLFAVGRRWRTWLLRATLSTRHQSCCLVA